MQSLKATYLPTIKLYFIEPSVIQFNVVVAGVQIENDFSLPL